MRNGFQLTLAPAAALMLAAGAAVAPSTLVGGLATAIAAQLLLRAVSGLRGRLKV